MDRRITSRLNMMNSVNGVADARPETFATIPAFIALLRKSKALADELKALIKKSSGKKGGAKLEKTQRKAKLALNISIICGQGVAYARNIKDQQMENDFDIPISILETMKDTQLIETSNLVLDMAKPIEKKLEDYGVTADFRAATKDALERFEAKNPSPMVDVYVGEADNEELLAKAFECSDFMFNEFMKAASIFKVLDLNFYNSLENAARISKVGVKHDDPEAKAISKALKEAKAELKKRETAAKLSASEDKKRKEQEELNRLLALLAEPNNVVAENSANAANEVGQPAENGVS